MSERRSPLNRKTSSGSKNLERAIRLLGDRLRRTQPPSPALESLSPPAFRSVVAHRLQALEREVGELRARINGLVFVVVGAVVTQLVLRLIT
jgi:hypothetical protein